MLLATSDPPLLNPNCQVWQFLLECLENNARFANIIQWTSNVAASPPASPTERRVGGRHGGGGGNSVVAAGGEFCILDARELAKYWAIRRGGNNNIGDCIQRFNRVLRYYHNKKRLLHKVVGKANTYVFLIDVQPYLNVIRSSRLVSATSTDNTMLD